MLKYKIKLLWPLSSTDQTKRNLSEARPSIENEEPNPKGTLLPH